MAHVQGPVDLTRGLTGAILGTIPVAMVYFGTYEACKGFMERRQASGAVTHLTSASVGAVLSAFVRVPTDTLKHQTQAYIVPNIFQAGAPSPQESQGFAQHAAHVTPRSQILNPNQSSTLG